MEKADELRFDIFLDFTSQGRPLYEANGFSYLQESNTIRPRKDRPDRQWPVLEKKVGAIIFWSMKRNVSQAEKMDEVGWLRELVFDMGPHYRD